MPEPDFSADQYLKAYAKKLQVIKQIVESLEHSVRRADEFRRSMFGGGQHVGTGGEFQGASPSTLATLMRYIRDLREAID